MFKLQKLLKYEYFPSELPPCFTTNMLADEGNIVKGWVNSSSQKYSRPCIFSGFKNVNSRRKFAIPNPYHYVKAVDCIVKNKKDIENICNKSLFSLSSPLKGKIREGSPYNKRSYNVLDTRKEIENLYQNNRYQIQLDIAGFFESIYTHSIPWAMHGKERAKASKGKEKLVGEQLDFCMQSMNYEQTSGILVGNAVSRIISEIILCEIDSKIKAEFPNLELRRFVDDYYIYVKNAYEIQAIIAFINKELANFELRLNENKINITESPFIYGKPWLDELKLYIHLDKHVFINKAISLFNLHKDISILRYGLTVISLHKFNKEEWNIIESKLINLWCQYTVLGELVLKILLYNNEYINKKAIEKAIFTILDTTIPINYQQEVIWTIWCAKTLEIEVNSKHVVDIIKSKNTLAIIIVLDILNNTNVGKIKEVEDALKSLNNDLKEDPEIMWSPYWLLAYELDVKGWKLDNEENVVIFTENIEFFEKLKNKNISFYDNTFIYELGESEIENLEYLTRREFLKYIYVLEEKFKKLDIVYKEYIEKLESDKSDKIEKTKEELREDVRKKMEEVFKENQKVVDMISNMSRNY